MSNKINITSQISSTIITGAKWIFVVNIVQKLSTFALNQALIRWTPPEVFGQAFIQYDLLLSTLLFLSREGIRLSVLRANITNDRDRQEIVNLSWIPPVLLTVVIVFQTLFGYFANGRVAMLYCTGALLESLGEPFYNVFQSALEIHARLRAETVAVSLRCLVAFYCIAHLRMGIAGFGVAQVVYGGAYTVVLVVQLYFSHIRTDLGERLRVGNFFPRSLSVNTGQETPWLLRWLATEQTASVAWTLTLSSVVKHLLTEADKIALNLAGRSSAEMGVYAVTNNYGSLVARMVFLPVEDSARIAFAKGAADVRTRASAASASLGDPSRKHTRAQDVQAVVDSLRALCVLFSRLVRLMAAVGVFFPVVGCAYSELAVGVLFAPQWRIAETVQTLSLYCAYIFVLGVNGVTEAFVQAVAPPASLGRLGAGLVGSTAMFAVSVVPCVQLFGTGGIVLANALSMAARVAFNLWFVHGTFSRLDAFIGPEPGGAEGRTGREGLASAVRTQVQSPLRDLLPSGMSLGCLAAAASVAQVSARVYSANRTAGLKPAAIHLGVGVAVAVGLLAAQIYLAPRDDLQALRALLFRGRVPGRGKSE